MRISLFGLIYLAIGLVVALTHGYNSVAGALGDPVADHRRGAVAGRAVRRRPAPAGDRHLTLSAPSTRGGRFSR